MRKFGRLLCFVCLIAALMLSGCARSTAAQWREYKLFCGMSSSRGEVSETEWRAFCERHVSAAFPDGYTVLAATGYWRSDAGVTASESCRVLLIAAPPEAEAKVRALAARYREQFAQKTVLLVTSDAAVDLIGAEP